MTANNYLLDKYFNELDEEHLTLKYQLTPEEVKSLEDKYFDEFLTELREKKGKDYAIRALSLKKSGNNKCSLPAEQSRSNYDIGLQITGGNSAEDKMITMLKNISLSDLDIKIRIAVMFNMIFSIYDKWLFPAGIKNVPDWGQRYMQILSSMYGKFDQITAETMQKIIRGYISSVLKENGVSEIKFSPNVLLDYVNMLGLVGNEYAIIDYGSLLNYLSIYEGHSVHLRSFRPECLKQKRLQLWKEIVELQGKDFDMHGYSVNELEEIKNSLLISPI